MQQKNLEKASKEVWKVHTCPLRFFLQQRSVMQDTYTAAAESCLETGIWSSNAKLQYPCFTFIWKLEQILFEEICLPSATDSKKLRSLSHRRD